MKKIIFAVAFLVATAGVFETSNAAWFSKKSSPDNKANSVAAVGQPSSDRSEGKKVELSMVKKGEIVSVVASGATITSKGVSDFFASVSFGSYVVPVTVKAGSSTIIRRFERVAPFSEISVGDIVEFKGTLDTTAASLTVNAREIKDFSIQAAGANYNGTIAEINASEKSFFLKTSTSGNIKVFVVADTKITASPANSKQKQSLAFADLATDMRVISVKGVVNTRKTPMELMAKEIFIAKEAHIAAQRPIINEPGTITAIDGGNLPTSMKIKSQVNKFYKVNMTSETIFKDLKIAISGATEETEGSFNGLKKDGDVLVSGTFIVNEGTINASKIVNVIRR